MSTLPSITHIAESRPLARTSHTCTICGTSIAIGTRYIRYVYRDDDALDRRTAIRQAKLHVSCPRKEDAA